MSSKSGINSFASWRPTVLHSKQIKPNSKFRHSEYIYSKGESSNNVPYRFGDQSIAFEELPEHDILRYERGKCLSGVFASRKRVPSRVFFNNERYR